MTVSPQAAHGRTALVGGRSVRYRVAGSGPPLVLVHGLSASSRWWRPVLDPLAREFTVYLLDLPRFGRALHPSRAAGWLEQLLAQIGLERTHLLGHSLGGLVATKLAAGRPELIDRLVLVAPAGFPAGRGFLRYGPPVLGALRRSPPRFVPTILADSLRAGPASLVRGARYAIRQDLRGAAAAITAPTLLVWGTRDRLVPAALAVEWERAVPDARVVLLEGAGHGPMVDEPRRFADEVVAFLRPPN